MQLLGYGLPVAVTNGGRIASIGYIMLGIPIFLIILKDVGQLLSRALRKLYKRIHSAKQRLPDGRRMSAPVKVSWYIYYLLRLSVVYERAELTRQILLKSEIL
jgi:hypothetical protein